jgi:hypothetical protein
MLDVGDEFREDRADGSLCRDDGSRGAAMDTHQSDNEISYCANPYWAQCQHRMACQRCDFYVPGDSARAQALEANTHNQRLLEQIPMTEIERKALTGDQAALEQLAKGCSLSK